MAAVQRTATADGNDDARAVQCGLVPPDFKARLRIFSPEYYRIQKTACLQDRMAFYTVPGVTIALIDGGRIAWTSEHGVLEAGTNRRVVRDSVRRSKSLRLPTFNLDPPDRRSARNTSLAVTSHGVRGAALALAGRREQAIESYRKVIALDPTNANARARLKELEKRDSSLQPRGAMYPSMQ